METSDCLRCRHLLSAAMDGEATFNETEFVRKHLAGCADCREAQQAYNSLRAQLRLLPTPEPPVALRTAVMSRINGKKAVYAYARPRPVTGLYSLLAPWQKGIFAAAVLALVFVSGFILSMLLLGQPFEVEGQVVADTADQKVVIIFTRPVDRNYIMANAPTLFSIKDAQNNPLQIDTANIVITGNRVELPIKRDSGRLQENEQIEVVVAPQIKDEKGAAVANPGPKVAVAATQAPDVAAKTKPGQVVAAATTPVPPTSTTAPATAPATTAVPQTTAPVVQPNSNPTATTAPLGTTPATTVTVTKVVSTTAPATSVPTVTTTAVPVTNTVTISPSVPVTTPVNVSPSPTATVSTSPSVSPATTVPPSTSPVATTFPPTTTKTPATVTVGVTKTPVVTATTPARPSTSPGTLTASTTVGSPPASPTATAPACKPVELGPGFEKLYLEVETRLGCPTTAPTRSGFTYQVFQKGSMLYYQQTGRIYVFYNFGGWASYRATGAVVVPPTTGTSNTTVTPGSVTPNPSGCSLKPRGSFGTLWTSNQAVQTSLGCPVDVDSSTSGGLSQNFSRGLMLYNPLASLPYSIVYADGGFQAYLGE